MFNWLRKNRRADILAEVDWDEWARFGSGSLWQFAYLSEPEQRKLLRTAAIIVAEKNWEGVDGVEVTEEMQRAIAVQMSLLCLGFEDQYFSQVKSILIRSRAYAARSRTPVGGVGYIDEPSYRLGEAWHRGPVILTWPEVVEGGRDSNDGHHLVIHEFAHQLDMLNGSHADGVPVIESAQQAERWLSVCDAGFERLRQECQLRQRPFLDCYGTTNKAEFFAVASEAFFQTPRRMQHSSSELFDELKTFYRQDPLRWAPTSYS